MCVYINEASTMPGCTLCWRIIDSSKFCWISSLFLFLFLVLDFIYFLLLWMTYLNEWVHSKINAKMILVFLIIPLSLFLSLKSNTLTKCQNRHLTSKNLLEISIKVIHIFFMQTWINEIIRCTREGPLYFLFLLIVSISSEPLLRSIVCFVTVILLFLYPEHFMYFFF